METDWLLRDPQNPKWMKYSVEFCGGTHVKNTAEIEAFVLTHEEGVAKGVRRVVGISGDAAKKSIALGDQLLAEANALAGKPPVAPPGEPRSSDRAESSTSETPRGLKSAARDESPIDNRQSTIENWQSAIGSFTRRFTEAQISLRTRRQIQSVLVDVQKLLKEQEKQAAGSSADAVMNATKALFESAQTIGGVTVVVGEVPAANADALRAAIDWIRNKTTASAVLLACVEPIRDAEESDSEPRSSDRADSATAETPRGLKSAARTASCKVVLVAGMSKAVVERGLKAGDLIKEICPLVGGKGGGRPDMAQGGGTDSHGLAGALKRADDWIASKLN